jgi:hypothetical protein
MKVEDLKAAFYRLSLEDKRRFMQEISLDFCHTMMADAASFKRLLSACLDGPGPIDGPMRTDMKGWMGKGSQRRRR